MDKKTEHFNPHEMVQTLFEVPAGSRLSHLHYDKWLNRHSDYQIIRTMTHDSTLAFTYMLLTDVLKNLVNKTSHCLNDDITGITDIEYTIGDIKLESEIIDGKMKQVASIPVKCKYDREKLTYFEVDSIPNFWFFCNEDSYYMVHEDTDPYGQEVSEAFYRAAEKEFGGNEKDNSVKGEYRGYANHLFQQFLNVLKEERLWEG